MVHLFFLTTMFSLTWQTNTGSPTFNNFKDSSVFSFKTLFFACFSSVVHLCDLPEFYPITMLIKLLNVTPLAFLLHHSHTPLTPSEFPSLAQVQSGYRHAKRGRCVPVSQLLSFIICSGRFNDEYIMIIQYLCMMYSKTPPWKNRKKAQVICQYYRIINIKYNTSNVIILVTPQVYP